MSILLLQYLIQDELKLAINTQIFDLQHFKLILLKISKQFFTIIFKLIQQFIVLIVHQLW